jgi:hypothetical protein
MYHQLQQSEILYSAHNAFLCFAWIWEQTTIFSLYNNNIAFYNQSKECLLRGTDWVCNSYIYSFVRDGLMVGPRHHKLVTLPATEPRIKTAARAAETALQPNSFVHSEFCTSFVHAWDTSQRATTLRNEPLASWPRYYTTTLTAFMAGSLRIRDRENSLMKTVN